MVPQGKVRVLVADDHALIREGLRKILEMEDDLEVVGESSDGPTTLAKARELQPDVVTLDVSMPGMSGLEVARRLREELPGVKIVILTVHSDQACLLDAVRAGGQAYLLKDSEPERLVEAIRTVHAGGTYFPREFVSHLVEDYRKVTSEVAAAGDALAGSRVQLTARETEILRLIAQGASNREIAQRLFISEKTVKNHVSSLLRKLELEGRTQAAIFALRNRLVE
ncbi:MAG: response regulator [Betaproteobacteria bacterium]